MRANQIQFLPFLEGKKQFITPIYQRPYSWTKEQCMQLWNDIVTVGTDEARSNHFLGSVVFIQEGLYQAARMIPLLIIDGQQRLTTLTILLVALAQISKEPNSSMAIDDKDIYDSYLTNAHGKEEEYYKMVLTEKDKKALQQLIDHPERIKDSKISHRIFNNYLFFIEQLQHESINPQDIYNGISKLVIVEISLDKDRDHPQLIFESLNSTGMDLSQSDLIRNYIFMDMNTEEQKRLYKSYWAPMEQYFEINKNKHSLLEERRFSFFRTPMDSFDRFMRDYLVAKKQRLTSNIYASFKKYRQSNIATNVEDIISDLYRYAGYYMNVVLAQENDKEIKQIFQSLRYFGSSISYSFIIEVYNDYSKGDLFKEDFLIILKFIETYFFRLSICSLPDFFLDRLFRSIEIDKKNYLASVIGGLLKSEIDKPKFPTDEEFKSAFISKNMYNSPLRNYIFFKLENFKRKEIVNISEYTVEHIMPQNIKKSLEWQEELGDNWKKVHSRYLHTIGNLTITGYNSELSNRSFKEKRDMVGGFADSPLRLNKGLAKLDHWNEESIQIRALTLAENALQIWNIPLLTSSQEKYIKKFDNSSNDKIYTLKDHKALKGGIYDLYLKLRTLILGLDVTVQEVIREKDIIFKTKDEFVCIKPVRKYLDVILDIPLSSIDDQRLTVEEIPADSLFDIAKVKTRIINEDQLEDVMKLIRQSYEAHLESIED
ncbi:DUF262 and DUF1524 domain-containing protein [Tengunoibacter tsumagoiensis]|uniref:DUF262 domain-containing protein n=1 Tax=Tengunoibacter tsumagoiensis TaxID=2014871 RepID=A0A402A7T1_9CHLR|nr:DUF262 and DUF1524 domain-containing protein [Tengunoibacter tsumagoiensis]GCE15056.1 hypothetical protein KTT_49150 [Tengunoibacter tsumagoiensis]